MDLKGQSSQWPQRYDRSCGKALIWRKVAVEDIQMDEIQAGGFETSHFVRQMAMIAVEKRCAQT